MAWVDAELERRSVAPAGFAVTATDVDVPATASRKKVVKRAREIVRQHDCLPVKSDGQAAP
jgi:hypothetical protein